MFSTQGPFLHDLAIRPLREAEARSVLSLLREVFGRSRTTLTTLEEFTCTEDQERAYLRKFAHSPNLALGAFQGRTLIGTAFLEQLPHLRTQHRGGIGLCVHPDFWSRGVGTRLLETLIKAARSQAELRSLEASVLANNPASERLFRSAGFRLGGVHPEAARIDGNYCDERFFVLQLTERPNT